MLQGTSNKFVISVKSLQTSVTVFKTAFFPLVIQYLNLRPCWMEEKKLEAIWGFKVVKSKHMKTVVRTYDQFNISMAFGICMFKKLSCIIFGFVDSLGPLSSC